MKLTKEQLYDALNEAFLKTEWNEHHFELSNGVKFSICHNMPDTSGLSIQDAFDNWIVRTTVYSDESFVEYIMSKYYMHGNFAMTRATWDEINS